MPFDLSVLGRGRGTELTVTAPTAHSFSLIAAVITR